MNCGTRVPYRCLAAAVVICIALGDSAWAANEPNDTYSGALQRAAKLQRAGRIGEAIKTLVAIEQKFAQDYALALQLGWLNFQASNYPIAERYYRRALSLAPDSKDARHGLGWTLLRLDRRQPARIAFEKVLKRWPDTALARKGLALLKNKHAHRPTTTLSPSVHSTVHLYQSHPSKSAALGLTASLPLRLLDDWRFNLTYRYSRYWLEEQPWRPWAPSPLAAFDQHALFVSGGADFARWGLVGHYAYLHDGSDFFDYTFLAGLSARYSPFGDLLADWNVGIYPDMMVYNIAAAWRSPQWGWLSVMPAVHLQQADSTSPSPQLEGESDKTLLSASATLTASNSWGELWCGGRFGTAVRPASLELQVVYNNADRVSYGAWVGGQLHLGAGWSLLAAYELVRLETPIAPTPIAPTTSAASNLHLMTIGASWTSARR